MFVFNYQFCMTSCHIYKFNETFDKIDLKYLAKLYQEINKPYPSWVILFAL